MVSSRAREENQKALACAPSHDARKRILCGRRQSRTTTDRTKDRTDDEYRNRLSPLAARRASVVEVHWATYPLLESFPELLCDYSKSALP
jgi:hypothetical protein